MAVTPIAVTRHPNGWSFASATGGIVNSAVAVTVAASPPDNNRNYMTGLQIQTATLGGATELAVRDGAGGTVLWRTQLQTGPLALTDIEFETPLQGSPTNLLEVVTLTAVTGGVYVNAQGYAAP
jgi:hypothetical protein